LKFRVRPETSHPPNTFRDMTYQTAVGSKDAKHNLEHHVTVLLCLMLNGIGEDTSELEFVLRAISPSAPDATIKIRAHLLRHPGFWGETLVSELAGYIQGVAMGASAAELADLVIDTKDPALMEGFCRQVGGRHRRRVSQYRIIAQVMTS